MKSHPRISRALQATAVLVGVITLLTGCLSAEQQSGVDVLNRDRTAHRIAPVRAHGQLQSKAQAWAERLARENRLYHSTLSSGAPSCWRGLGENVGYGSSIGQIEAAYMNSSAHRANILNAKYDWVGLGVAHRGSRVFTVQVFMDGC